MEEGVVRERRSFKRRSAGHLSSNSTSPSASDDGTDGRRVSSRQRKPSWRVSFDPSDSAEKNKLCEREREKPEKFPAPVGRPRKVGRPPKENGQNSIPSPSSSSALPFSNGDARNEELPSIQLKSLRKRQAESPAEPESEGEPEINREIKIEDIKIERPNDDLEQSLSSQSQSPIVRDVVERKRGRGRPRKIKPVEMIDYDSPQPALLQELQLNTSQQETKTFEKASPKVEINVKEEPEEPEENSRVEVEEEDENAFDACQCTKSLFDGSEIQVEKKALTEEEERSGFFCQAVELIDNRRIGCSRLCPKDLRLSRSSPRTIFKAFCSYHTHRLKLHQCCPICGDFCTQGEGIMLCTASGFTKTSKNWTSHLFHKNCALEEASRGLDKRIMVKPEDQVSLLTQVVCPHCGQTDDLNEISLKIKGDKMPVFVPTREPVVRNVAVMMFSKQKPIISTKDDILHYIEDITAVELGAAMEKAKSNLDDLKKLSPLEKEDLLKEGLKNVKLLDVMLILLNGREPNRPFKSPNQEYPLHMAVSSKSMILIHGLIVSGANPNVCDASRLTPLMQAAIESESSIIKYLIASGAKKLEVGPGGLNCLQLAVKSGSIHAVESLLEDHIDLLEIPEEKDGLTPLMLAAKFKQSTVLDILLRFSADVKKLDKKKNTALHWAAHGGSLQSISALIQHGINIDALNIFGNSSLHMAIEKGHDGAVLTLLMNGADPLIKNMDGCTPLDICGRGDDAKKKAIKAIIEQTICLRQVFEKKKPKYKKYKAIINDASKGKEPHVNISVVNEADSIEFPTDFTYVRNCIHMNSSINPEPNPDKIHKCRCEGERVCKECHTNRYDSFRRLAFDSFVDNDLSIRECNELCQCSPRSCANRVVQLGITRQLQIFRSKLKGWGVRAIEKIPRGSFVCEFAGEVLQTKEAGKRENDSFMFQLFADSGGFVVDASRYGNVGRFLNHSCEPNTMAFPVFVHHSDARFPRVGLFAIRDIEAHEEITFDYGDKFWQMKESGKGCYCKSGECRYLPDKIEDLNISKGDEEDENSDEDPEDVEESDILENGSDMEDEKENEENHVEDEEEDLMNDFVQEMDEGEFEEDEEKDNEDETLE